MEAVDERQQDAEDHQQNVKIDEELDGDCEDLEQSHENHSHGDWHERGSEGFPYLRPPPKEHVDFRSSTSQMLKESLHITKTVAKYIERKVHTMT